MFTRPFTVISRRWGGVTEAVTLNVPDGKNNALESAQEQLPGSGHHRDDTRRLCPEHVHLQFSYINSRTKKRRRESVAGQPATGLLETRAKEKPIERTDDDRVQDGTS